MRFIFSTFLFCFLNIGIAQIYFCKDGLTSFTSEAPLELIKAKTNKTIGVIDCANKTVAFSINVDLFDGFKNELQKEHFKENYLETQSYPSATFKGKIIEDIDFNKMGTYTVRAKGFFNIHGVNKEKIIKTKITIKDKELFIETTFELPLEEYDIKVPKVVNQKIASVIMVDVKATLKPKA